MGGPETRPSETTLPIDPSAWPRILGGKTSVTIAGPIAIIAAAPKAWSTRAATRPDSPAERPQSADPSENAARPPT